MLCILLEGQDRRLRDGLRGLRLTPAAVLAGAPEPTSRLPERVAGSGDRALVGARASAARRGSHRVVTSCCSDKAAERSLAALNTQDAEHARLSARITCTQALCKPYLDLLLLGKFRALEKIPGEQAAPLARFKDVGLSIWPPRDSAGAGEAHRDTHLSPWPR